MTPTELPEQADGFRSKGDVMTAFRFLTWEVSPTFLFPFFAVCVVFTVVSQISLGGAAESVRPSREVSLALCFDSGVEIHTVN